MKLTMRELVSASSERSEVMRSKYSNMAAGGSSRGFRIREAKRDDCRDIALLIQELADYEKMPDGPKINEKVLLEDGFGEHPYFHCFVCEVPDNEKKIVGYALYFFVYSTWEGKSVYMEDLYVSPEYRKKGIGMALWRRIAQVAVKKGCSRLSFGVLDWNKPSIDFYRSFGAVDLTQLEGWHMFRLKKEALYKLADEEPEEDTT